MADIERNAPRNQWRRCVWPCPLHSWHTFGNGISVRAFSRRPRNDCNCNRIAFLSVNGGGLCGRTEGNIDRSCTGVESGIGTRICKERADALHELFPRIALGARFSVDGKRQRTHRTLQAPNFRVSRFWKIEPVNASRTISPGSEKVRIKGTSADIGFCVGWSLLPL